MKSVSISHVVLYNDSPVSLDHRGRTERHVQSNSAEQQRFGVTD